MMSDFKMKKYTVMGMVGSHKIGRWWGVDESDGGVQGIQNLMKLPL